MPPLTMAWAYGVLVAVLVIAAVADVRTGKIPNWLTYPAIAAGLIGHTLVGGLQGDEETRLGLMGSLGGFATGFLPLLAAFLAGGVGGGDAKLMGAVGALTGWRFALSAMLLGFLAAALLAFVVMIKHRVLKRTLLRIGRFFLLALAPRGAMDPASPDSPKVPFGLGLCIGSAVALAEALARGTGAVKWVLRI